MDFPSNFTSKLMIFYHAYCRNIVFKGLDVPFSIPLITRGFSSHPQIMKELRLPALNYFLHIKVVRLNQMRKDIHPHAQRHTCTNFFMLLGQITLIFMFFCSKRKFVQYLYHSNCTRAIITPGLQL